MAEPGNTPTSPLLAGLALRCPNCAKGRLFKSYLKLADRCTACGEDLSALEQGDGPAVFVTLILGFLVVGLALFVEVRYTPPFWVHAVLWLPLTLGGSLALLAPLKGLLIGVHFRHRKGDVERG
jgi:uncharacterized protein (DUF983 family)